MYIQPMLRILMLSLLLIVAPVSAWSDSSDTGWEKVVFHVDESRYANWALMLARSYLEDSPKAKLVFVVYGPGVDFLSLGAKDKSGNPYDTKVLKLAEQGVEFRVCETTLKARGIDKDELLDEVRLVPSGISEIARLQIKEGYAYLKP